MHARLNRHPLHDADAGLVARVGRGDEAAARAMVSAKLPRVLALARRITGDAAEAEDIAQEAFVRAWRHASRWRPGGARFDTWLHMVTLNLCRDQLRRRRERTTGDIPDTADPAPLADTTLDCDQQSGAIAQAVAALPERQLEAILLAHYQDLGNIEAAKAMNISVDALESLLARGRRSLRAIFAGQERADD